MVIYTKLLTVPFEEGQDILEYNWFIKATKIKTALLKDEYHRIVNFTGIHFEWSIMQVLSDCLNLNTFTYDYFRDGTSYSLNGVAILQEDVRVCLEKEISPKSKRYLLNYAQQHINEKYYNIQDEETVDFIFFPLNIFWDSAAFGKDDIFKTFKSWLVETIDYILNNIKYHVVVRQHPYEQVFNTGKEVQAILLDQFGDHKYFTFYSSKDEINSYSLLKRASLVLPNTTTLGLEAAMVGKPVIVKNNVYYADSRIVNIARTKDEYFEMIEAFTKSKELLGKKDKELAMVYYALSMHNKFNTSFGQNTDDLTKWIQLDFEELLNMSAVQYMLKGITEEKILLEHYLENEFNEINIM